MTPADWWATFVHFAMLSLLSVSGALAMAPDMQRFLVGERHWMSAQQFADAVTIAQIAPGPNLLFVLLLGVQAGGWLGATAMFLGLIVPSSVLAFYGHRWQEQQAGSRLVRALRYGLPAIAVGLTIATAFTLARSSNVHWTLWLFTLAAAGFMLKSKRNPLWLIAAGALAGMVMGQLGWLP